MKKVNYLMTILTALVLMACSCEKDPVVPEPETIDITGNWYFDALTFNDTVYTSCDDDLNEIYDLVTFELSDVTTTTLTLYSGCIDYGENELNMGFSYVIIDNQLRLEDVYVFEIQNMEDYDGTVLELKLLSGGSSELPYDGVYTLTR